MVVWGKRGCILAKWLNSGKSGYILPKWFYLGKVVVFGQNLLCSGKSNCIRAKVVQFV